MVILGSEKLCTRLLIVLSGNQGTLPLGWNSSFLNAALAQNATPSRYWSLWPGSRSIDYSVPGELVVGGIDVTRFEPQNVATFQSTSSCTLCPIVTGLTWDTDNGSVNIFSNASEALQISLQPAINYLTVTPDMFANFANATGASLTLDPGVLAYDAAQPPVGNLTVTLRGGYQTQITSADLFVYPRGYINGTYSVTNSTFLLAEMVAQNNTGYVKNWGVPYLTFNYLMVDYARSQFQLAPAIRTDFSSQGGGYELSAVCDPVTTVTSTPVSSSPVPPVTITSSTSKSSSPKSGNNTGAIVGGVVGGVLGLALILGGLALLFYRSRKQNKTASVTPREQMAQPERVSQYTAYTGTTPRGAYEVDSTTKSNPEVENWINSAGSDAMPSATFNSPPHPLEMPSEHY
ncbi:hypothetical protein EDD37DRAFT_640728 [Exophiala viscosa]|uniref:uncharacterized protein n=1 Tax=Exophiala viscosa TaxID=2486360 RepID=UPI002198BB07|nr:hypothetical protein EDD37DRAFT_640728 [Exophiala viscosa]